MGMLGSGLVKRFYLVSDVFTLFFSVVLVVCSNNQPEKLITYIAREYEAKHDMQYQPCASQSVFKVCSATPAVLSPKVSHLGGVTHASFAINLTLRHHWSSDVEPSGTKHRPESRIWDQPTNLGNFSDLSGDKSGYFEPKHDVFPNPNQVDLVP